MAEKCDWGHYEGFDSLDEDAELETALLAQAKPSYRHPRHHRPPRQWPRILLTQALRVQLQLRHRLGITVSLPALPWPTTRLPHSLSLPINSLSSPSTKTRKLAPRRLPFLILHTLIHAFLLAPPLLLVMVLLYGGVPPSFADVRQRERALPQHLWDVAVLRMSGGAGVRSMQRKEGGEDAVQEMYLRFPDHAWGHGLNNILQEAILTTHLTLTTSTRTPVFEPYTWSHLPLPYTLYDFALRPTRVPLSAFVGGVLTGAVGVDHQLNTTRMVDADADDNSMTRRTRRSVSAEYFEHVCPPSEIVEVVYGLSGTDSNSVEVDDGVPQQASAYVYPHPAPAWYADGGEILAWFEKRLQAPDVREKRCVVVREDGEKVKGARRVFDTDFFGVQGRIHPILPALLEGPVLKHFEWSSLVSGAVERSIKAAFGPTLEDTEEANNEATDESTATHVQNNVKPHLDGVLALHLRRGDYGRHCVRLAEWDAGYLGVNRLLEDELKFVDGDTGVDVDVEGELESEAEQEEGVAETKRKEREEREKERERGKGKRKEAFYLKHCLPSIEQVVERLREVRAEYESNPTSISEATDDANDIIVTTTATAAQRRLRNVYVLTNGWPAFVDALRKALLADGWAGVVATDDLERGEFVDVSEPSSSMPPTRPWSLLNWSRWNYSGDADRAQGLTREERGVGVAIDMGIAERAEVFVGNGFSSLSANIVMLRMARGFERGANRLL